MTRKLKFLHVNQRVSPDIQAAFNEKPRRSGMYNWMFAFGGDLRPFQFVKDHEWAEYDVVQVNMSPADMNLIPKIHYRQKEMPETAAWI